MPESVTIQGFKLKIGDKIEIVQAKTFEDGIYELNYISEGGTYVGMNEIIPEGDDNRPHGFGQDLTYFNDKRIVRKL